MALKNWFLSTATVTHRAVARFAEVSAEEVSDAADELEFGARLTCPQVEEVLQFLDEDSDAEDDDSEEEEEGDEDEPSDGDSAHEDEEES